MSRTDTAIPSGGSHAVSASGSVSAAYTRSGGALMTRMTGRFEHLDARPGGSYRLVLTYADAREGLMPWRAEEGAPTAA